MPCVQAACRPRYAPHVAALLDGRDHGPDLLSYVRQFPEARRAALVNDDVAARSVAAAHRRQKDLARFTA